MNQSKKKKPKKQAHTGRTTMKACLNPQRGAAGCLYTSLMSINGGPQVPICSWCQRVKGKK